MMLHSMHLISQHKSSSKDNRKRKKERKQKKLEWLLFISLWEDMFWREEQESEW